MSIPSQIRLGRARLRGFFDAGGGTRTPDTRIMIGALALVYGGAKAGYAGFGGIRRGQICRVGDTVRDAVDRHRGNGVQARVRIRRPVLRGSHRLVNQRVVCERLRSYDRLVGPRDSLLHLT